MIDSGLPPLTLSRLQESKGLNVEPKQSIKASLGRATRKTTRKPKTTRVERTRAGGEWTEAAFWSFLRSGLRQLSRRWPPIVRGVWLESRRAYHGPNKRQKWEHQCAVCDVWAIRKVMQADHIRPCGRLHSWDDLPGFVQRMLCETDGLRILCAGCHLTRRGEEELP